MLLRIFNKLLQRGVDAATAEEMAQDIVVQLSDDRMGQARDAIAQKTPPAEPLVTYELTDEQMERMLDLYMQNREVVLADDRMGQAEEALAQATPPPPSPLAERPMDTPANREPQTFTKPGEEPTAGRTVSTASTSDASVADTARTGGSIYSTLTEPGRFGRKFVVPADEDPEEFTDLFEQLFKRYGSSSGTTFATGKPSELAGWDTRLDSAEMRGLFAPTESFMSLERRSSTQKDDAYNNLVDEALNAASARRQRVGANIFIRELIDSLPTRGETFVPNTKFNAGPINHAEHIYAFNQFVFGRQIDMDALLRGRTVDVGDVKLSDSYVIPDVKLSSIEDYVELRNALHDDIIKDDPNAATKIASLFGNRPQELTGEFDRVTGFNEETGLDYDLDQARALFEVPVDWLLLYDDRIESVEAAYEERDVLETTIKGLTSTQGEDVGGALIRSGYTDELQGLTIGFDDRGFAFGPDKELVEDAQAQVGVVQPPGFSATDPDDFPVIAEGGFDPEELQTIGDSFGEMADGGVGLPVNSEEYDLLRQYLKENYGGFSFFFDLDAEKLQVGLNQYDKPVPVDSPDAYTTVHILDYIVGEYDTHDMSGRAGQVTDDRQLYEALRTTEWWQTTNVSMREWEGKYGADPLRTFQFDLEQTEREDIVGVNKDGSIYKNLVQAAREIMGAGAEQTIGKNRLIMLAAEIDYLGYDTDNVEQRKRLLDSVVRSEEPWQASSADFSAFRLSRDSVESMARRFYLPITEERRNSYAEKLFTGEMTDADVVAQMRTQALSRYGQSDQVRAALQAGLTMQDYFDPYIAEMQTILDRPVDLMMEFPEIIEMVSADGTARPMTHAELGEYVRGLPEWGQSDQGQDTARSVVSAIGTLFGETA